MVAEFGFAPKFRGYEPRELLLLYPAIIAHIILKYMIKCKFQDNYSKLFQNMVN